MDSASDSDDREGRKRPQGARPFHQRFFSGGSVNRNPIKEVSASSNELVIAPPRAQTPANLIVGDNPPSNDPRGVFLATLTESPVSSPSTSDELRSFSPTPFSSTLRGRPRPVKKSSLLSSGSSSISDPVAADELTSLSRRRWDDLRRHFLPSHRSTTSLDGDSTTPPPASHEPPRSSTPKHIRMPRLGFKQVVEQGQAVAADQTKKFADDILGAMRAMSSNDPRAPRKEREGTLATMATSLNMSFMSSNTNLGLGSTSISNYLPQNRVRAMRGQPSTQSMATLSHPPSTASASLYTVISAYASIVPNQPHLARFLPYEDEVLSSLLVPFMARQSENTESERSQAMEAFEIIVKTWRTPSDEAFLERCLWCCKVARVIADQADFRMRALDALSSYLLSSDDLLETGSPVILQTLFQALFSLQGSLLAGGDSEEASYVHELIKGIQKAGCEGLDASMLLQQYEAQLVSEADAHAILDCVIIMALAACMENAPDGEHRFILHNVVAVKERWFSAAGSSHYSPSLKHFETLSVTQCSNALLRFLLSSDGAGQSVEDYHLIFEVLTEWLIPVAHALVHNDSLECMIMSARLALHILSLSEKTTREAVVSLIGGWYRDHNQWRVAFEAAIQAVVKEDNWNAVVTILMALMAQLPNEIRSSAAMKFLPALNEKIAHDPPPLPFSAFTEFLDTVSQKFPKLFYKPLFACAAGTKTSSVLGHLRTVAILAQHLPSFWIRDAEMLLVALMSDSSATEKDSQGIAGAQWGQVRLGQLAILIELIAHVQAERQGQEARAPTDPAFLAQVQFFFELEYRLGVIIDGKERTLLIPVAQRILLVIFLFQIRLLLRSLKPAQWLSRVVSWVVSFEEDAQVTQNDSTSTLETIADIYSTLQRWAPIPQKRKSIVVLSPSASVDGTPLTAGSPATILSPFFTLFSRERQLKDFSEGLISNSLRLLVAVSGLLSREDHETLCATLWQRCLTQAASGIQTSATFLIMQCAEKAPTAILDIMMADIRSPEASRRLLAARRLSLISGWRFQMLSQDYIVDKNHRRPFRLARIPVSFIPTDLGSSTFVLTEDPEKENAASGQVLSPELRKRLADIGWTQDESTMDQKRGWIMTPFSLLSEQQLEKLEAGLPATIVSGPSQPGALERPPSPAAELPSSTHGVKRRSVFVPPLVSVLPDLAALAYDVDQTVANAARVAVMDWMRHDPALIIRPALDTLSGRETSLLHTAFSVIRSYLHTQNTLPPAMAYHVFNYLAGFLKYSARQGESEETLTGFAYAVPLLSKLVSQVSNMSLRDIRRAKVDVFLIPSGSLWFSSSSPTGPMFPRSLDDITSGSDSDTSYRLGRVVFIRVAQNLLYANMLRRNHQEVQAVRKNMPHLVLPITTRADDLSISTEPRSFLPKKERIPSFKTAIDANIFALSLLLSRSHILLVTEIFRSLPRHLNDRSDLAVLIDGLNQILLAHGDDIGIVAHVLIAFMTASARFHRLFTSGGGYTLFIPALFKVYAESEPNAGVRHAIEYSINRFYAIHQEAFVFQALNMLSHVVMSTEVDGPWAAKQIFLLLSTLSDSSPVHSADAAGIHGSSKTQEQEALMVRAAEEKPQAFLALLRRSSGSQGEDVGFVVPDQYEGGHLTLDNFVRLLLTVIGHNPSIRRAEQFLRLLRLMAPYFHDASSVARDVLREGIYALGIIFISRGTGKAKTAENSQIRGDESSDSFSQAAGASLDAFEAAKSPSNFVEMKLDYLSLVAEFSRSGGRFGPSALRRILDLVKVMLKDSDPGSIERVASFLSSFAHNVLVRNASDLQLKQILAFLNELGPIFKTHAAAADFSGVLEVVLHLAENPVYANEPTFSFVVVTHFCSAGLEAFERLASDRFAFSTPLRPVLVRLLCQATFLTGADIVGLMEQRHITFEFVAGILYPMALDLPSAAEIASDTRWMEAWRREAIRRTWICLLQLAMQACQRQGPASDRSDKSSQPERSRSQEKKGSSLKNSPAATLSMALQTLKIIVLKAEDELSISLPSIWVQIGSLLKSVLSSGGARFATLAQGTSVPSSPRESFVTLNPRTSEDSDPFNPSSPRFDPFRVQSPLRSTFPRPSLLDYLLWSILEFVCRHRSPLVLQMRLFIQEKAALLNEELHAQQALPALSRHLSYTSVFSKTRQKSGHSSRVPSPEASPFLTPPLWPYHGDVLLTPPKPERQPGYMRSPTTPGGSELGEPRIVHLGPVQNFESSPSPGLGESKGKSRKWLMANTTATRSRKLVLATYRRVRAVQRIMGYTELLPLPDDIEGDTDDVRVWSRGTTLHEIKGETVDLMEEFWFEDGG